MGLFNILEADATCPVCRKSVPFRIQFKYGATRQHEYKLGDMLHWRWNVVGEPDCKRVLVEAIGGPCINCGADYIEFDIILEHDRLDSVTVVGLERTIPSLDENGDWLRYRILAK